MLGNGTTKDNNHFGDTYIRNGSLFVDEDLIIDGSLQLGDPPYTLPESAGTDGQVITMNPDGTTTSFQDSGASQTARIIVNKFTALTTNNNNDFGNFRVIENTSVGTKNFSASEWTVNSEIRIKVVGYWNYQRADFPIFPTGIFAIRVGDANFPPIAPIELYNVQATNDYTGPTFPQTVDNEGYFNLDVSLVKLNNNQYSLRANLANSRQIINDFSYTGILTPDKLNNHPVTLGGASVDPFFCQIEWQDNTSQSSGLSYLRPSINRYEIDLVNSEGSIVGTTTAPATDHNSLANLTTGDAGHTQFALLGGRSGSQVLSGGITPAETLTLKSHTAGLNNIVIKDLNTTFEKNIDMNTNDITNANVIVRASNGNVIELDNDINPPLVTGALTIDSGAGKELRVASGAGLSLNSTSGSSYDTGTGSHLFRNTPDGTILSLSSQINASKSLNMNGNIITNTPTVSSSNSLQLKGLTVDEITINPNPSTGVSVFSDTGKSINLVADGGNQSMILDGTFITFSQGGGSFVPTFTASAFDMNNGNINNVDTINNTGSANINIPVVIGTPSGALQVQNGGAYIKQDLQVDGSIYCDSINNIRPSGGLYSESSGFNIPSTNLTETNLLGQGGSAGTLAIPANTFSQFDSYSFKASGVLSGGSNDTATLRLKSLVNGTTPVELGSIVIQLTDNGLVDVAWKVEADFNVRTLGGAGVGVLVLSGNFAYTNNNDVLKTYLRTIINNTVFDTTQSNELQFTYQNDGTNPLTNIRIDQASFTKWY